MFPVVKLIILTNHNFESYICLKDGKLPSLRVSKGEQPIDTAMSLLFNTLAVQCDRLEFILSNDVYSDGDECIITYSIIVPYKINLGMMKYDIKSLSYFIEEMGDSNEQERESVQRILYRT